MNSLLLLHGALGTAEQLSPLIRELGSGPHLHPITFEGHGSNAKIDRPFRVEHFAENVLSYMDRQEIQKADFFGYSMGGYVALFLAKHHPERVGRIATLGTILSWSPEKAAAEAKYLNPDKIEEKVKAFAELLEKSHPGRWKEVVLKTKELLLHLGENPPLSDSDWSSIEHTARLQIGDRDQTADLDDTIHIYKKLQNGELAVLPDTPHPIDRVDAKLLERLLSGFFDF